MRHMGADGMMMAPEGAAPSAGKMNGAISVTFEKEGVYGVRCKPHCPMGMVALLQVGEATNLDAAKAVERKRLADPLLPALFVP